MPRVDRGLGPLRPISHTACEIIIGHVVAGLSGKPPTSAHLDRPCWRETQSVLARILAEVAALPNASGSDDEVRVP